MDHQRIRLHAPGVAEVLLSDLVNLVSCFNLRGVSNTLNATLEGALNAVAALEFPRARSRLSVSVCIIGANSHQARHYPNTR